jgi:hypothetical protein
MKTTDPVPRRNKGVIVITLIVFMAMMSFYATTNLRTLAILKGELQLIEQKQTLHWRR